MDEEQIFRDRAQAGDLLAQRLTSYANRPDVLVLALPWGGVPVGFEVAKGINAPLDLFLVRKLAVPFQLELAMGAVTSGGTTVINDDVVRSIGITADKLESDVKKESAELSRRNWVLRGDRKPPAINGRTVILVDDGIATGTTVRAAITALRKQQPARLVVAVGVGPRSEIEALAKEVDQVVCLKTPDRFYGIGSWYENFSQISDEEVRELLATGASFGVKASTAEADCGQGENAAKTSIVEIPRDEWSEFFSDFNKQHEGMLVTTEMLGGEVGDQVEARELSFHGIGFQQKDHGSGEIEITAGASPDSHITSRITDPIHVWWKKEPHGAHEMLEIAAGKTTTLVRFRPGQNPRPTG